MTRVESKIQADIIRYLRGIGAYYLNVGGSASMAKGTADIVVCHQGRWVSLEIKRPDGTYGLTTPQRLRMDAVRRAGGISEVVTSVQETADLLKGLSDE